MESRAEAIEAVRTLVSAADRVSAETAAAATTCLSVAADLARATAIARGCPAAAPFMRGAEPGLQRTREAIAALASEIDQFRAALDAADEINNREDGCSHG